MPTLDPLGLSGRLDQSVVCELRWYRRQQHRELGLSLRSGLYHCIEIYQSSHPGTHGCRGGDRKEVQNGEEKDEGRGIAGKFTERFSKMGISKHTWR